MIAIGLWRYFPSESKPSLRKIDVSVERELRLKIGARERLQGSTPAALTRLLERLDPTDGIHTLRSIEFLQWRYDSELLGYQVLVQIRDCGALCALQVSLLAMGQAIGITR